ncbi:uncharacterized protein LOC133197204 isoform X2 [Saccostrea echinata]|nr:uncharacterized protein LOC133197204 isoform X2 [Saccostrea echinata]
MWWRTTIYFVMLGCVCGDETVSASLEENTTSSVPKSSMENVASTVNLIATPTTEFPSTQNFTLSPSTDVFLTPSLTSSEESVIGINGSVFTKSVDVSSHESFSNSLDTLMGYDARSTNTSQPEVSASPKPSQFVSVEPSLLYSTFSIPMESTTENFTSSESTLSPSSLTTHPYISSNASSFSVSSSIYLSSSVTENVSTTTRSLSSADNFTTIIRPALSSAFTLTETVPSPSSSEVVPSLQSVTTSVISTSYSDIESMTILPVSSQNDLISGDMETLRDLSSVEFSSVFPSISSSVYLTSFQNLQNETDSMVSSSLTTGNTSSFLQVATKISPQTTGSDLESFATQITDTTFLISSTSPERADSAFSFISTDIYAGKSQAASSVFTQAASSILTYPKELSTKTSTEPNSFGEITLETRPPPSYLASIYPTSIPLSSSILSRESAFHGFTHSISTTEDTFVPQSTSLYSKIVTSSSAYITTTESIPTTQRTDGTSVDLVTAEPISTTQRTDGTSVYLVFVNHTFEMIFKGNCEPLVQDKILLKTFWDQLQEKIIHRLNYPKISVSASNIACNPLRISFTLYQIPEKNCTLVFSSLKELVSFVDINVTIFGRIEHYKAIQVNMRPSVKDKGKDKLAGLEEIDLIVLIAAGAFCFVLISAGLVICIRESYRRKRTRTFELANKYQAEDFTLTKIPRPAVNYTEKGEDIHSNGHNNGDPTDVERETLMDSLHLRVNSNENGLMVGITGTLERQKAEPDSSPTPSVTDSEHLKVPLVSRKEETLQSQDNPIYYIDDEHNE